MKPSGHHLEPQNITATQISGHLDLRATVNVDQDGIFPGGTTSGIMSMAESLVPVWRRIFMIERREVILRKFVISFALITATRVPFAR